MAELPAPESALTDMIYRAWEERAESWDDLGFSPSLLGTECDRALWYQLHWAPAKERFDGRMLRLFRTGQIEEDRIIEDLIMCGLDVDPVDPATGKQFNVRALAGHVRGKTDGRINSGVPEAPKKTHIVEAKSHSEKSFNKLVQAGPGNLIEGKFDHWVQCQVYMHVLGIDRTLYSATCKNTDRRWNDRVKYDHEFGVWLFARLKRIIEPIVAFVEKAALEPVGRGRQAEDFEVGVRRAKPVDEGPILARSVARDEVRFVDREHVNVAELRGALVDRLNAREEDRRRKLAAPEPGRVDASGRPIPKLDEFAIILVDEFLDVGRRDDPHPLIVFEEVFEERPLNARLAAAGREHHERVVALPFAPIVEGLVDAVLLIVAGDKHQRAVS